jgi:hypothetical protein
MKFLRPKILPLAVAGALFAPPVFAQEPSSITEALKAGKAQLHFRTRYESVDQDGAEDAAATTWKSRLTYTSGNYQGFALTLEMEDITEIGKQDYSDGVTNRGTAVIGDPEVTEVNQAFISYTKGSTTAKYGRQRILLDNQRFVGNVGWRQDEQTYDGFTLASKPVANLSLFYGYITQVNRVFAEAQDHNHETHLINVKYETPVGAIIGYGYLLENKSVQSQSTDTFGLRWQGKAGSYINYNLEYATQKDAGESSLDYSADYTLAEIVGTIPAGSAKVVLTAGYEVLGSDDGVAAFITPLATLHAFQGWTDKFLQTPNTGIEDTYLKITTVFPKFSVGLVYDMFKANEGDADYGEEFGLVATTKLAGVEWTLKYADYSADSLFTDTQKLWLMAAVTF